MSIAGNLKTMDLAELLQWLSQGQKTGTLVVDNRKIEKRIFFRAGHIISSASTDPREYLGAFLISHGFISENQVNAAVKLQESSRMLLGKILVLQGAISEPDVHRMLRLKAQESIFDVFTWREGEFRFLDHELPSESMVPIDLDVTGVVLEGMHRIDQWRRIRQLMPDTQTVPVAIGQFAADEEDEDEEALAGGQQVFALIDDERSVADICEALHATEFFVCQHLLHQQLAGRIKLVKPRPSEAPVPVREATPAGPPAAAAPQTPPAGPAEEAERLVNHGGDLARSGQLDQALRYLRAGRALDPENRKLEAAAQRIEDGLRLEVERAGVSPNAVPVLTKPLEQLTQASISPQEGFLITRIDGSSTVQALARVCPMPALDTALVVWRLVRAGHVRFQRKG